MTRLKPKRCPFCGATNVPIHNSYTHAWYVYCGEEDCQAYGPLRGSKQDAIAAWNRRTPDTTARNEEE